MKLAYISGATSGIGEAFAELLAKKGIPLLLTGRDPERLRSVTERLSELVPVQSFTADLAAKEGRAKVVEEIRRAQPDLIVNNAGFGRYGESLHLSTAEQLEVVEVDACAVMEITIEAAKVLKEAGKKGTILNISSAAAFQVFPYFSSYAASKAFVNSFSRSLDFELQPHGIRVLAACPGQVETRFSQRASGRALKVNRFGLVMTTSFAAEELWRQVEKGLSLHIFDFRYRILTWLSAILPDVVVATLLRKALKSRL